MRKRKLATRVLAVFLLAVAASGVTSFFKHQVRADWWSASREPIGIAPDPDEVREAVIQVYGARAFNWRGYFGVHTWIALKPTDAMHFTIYEVVGWRARHGGSAVVMSTRDPDSRWYGAEPDLLADIRGEGVDEMIERVHAAARDYPYKGTYTVWPGPNSNTFIAHVARAVPELRLDLPPTAIGKDYLPGGSLIAETPSGTGYQFSLFGLFGVMAAPEEGFEVNILGLTFGVDIKDPAIKLPLAGRIGTPATKGS